MSDGLTEKQQRFVEEFLFDLNATAAAKRAGYSEDTAYSIGHENLKKPEIQEAIRIEREKQSQRTLITADRVLQEYARIAFSDITNYKSWDAKGNQTLKASSELSEDDTRAITEMTFESDVLMGKEGEAKLAKNKVKYKLHDKKGALDALAKHLGIDGKTQVSLETNNKGFGPLPVEGYDPGLI